MRSLIPSALALVAMGLGMIGGCNRSDSPDPSADRGNQGVDAPNQATFSVPGMS